MKALLLTLFLFGCNIAQAQRNEIKQPKLVIGIVVDQMRYDFLYRFYSKYNSGGFKRLMNDGLNCRNAHYNYYQTVTAAGHGSIYSGSVPAMNGMVGNNWYDRSLGREIYCLEDSTVIGVETTASIGKRSPNNLIGTTIGDQLRLGTNFKSRVFSISIKDRGAILPGGHTANGAFWFDSQSGKFVSSTYYGSKLPQSVIDYNELKRPSYFVQQQWDLIKPITFYEESTLDDQKWEGRSEFEATSSFPHTLKAPFNKPFQEIPASPFGNTILEELAEQLISKERLGQGATPDLLCISFSSPDYIGHRYGPNSIEIEDTYLRLDQDIERLLDYLDKNIGKDDYLLFLTADHGVMDVPAFWKANKLPSQNISGIEIKKYCQKVLEDKYGPGQYLVDEANESCELYLDPDNLIEKSLSIESVYQLLKKELSGNTAVSQVVNLHDIKNSNLPIYLEEMVLNGYCAGRSGDILILFKSGVILDKGIGTTHGTPYEYDTHVPLLFYGKGITSGERNDKISVSDIAASICQKLNLLAPSNNVGQAIWR